VLAKEIIWIVNVGANLWSIRSTICAMNVTMSDCTE
jgi:hypothetical protein